jgi:putative transposase
MPNHIHLLIEVKHPSMLNKIMRSINLAYTLHYNYKYNKVGHLWQDRYKSKLIEKDSYLLECIKYIEANPLRATLVTNIDQYPWCSHYPEKSLYPETDNMFI